MRETDGSPVLSNCTVTVATSSGFSASGTDGSLAVMESDAGLEDETGTIVPSEKGAIRSVRGEFRTRCRAHAPRCEFGFTPSPDLRDDSHRPYFFSTCEKRRLRAAVDAVAG